MSVDVEERVVFSSLSGFVRGGVTNLALEWVSGQVADYPDRHFYYQVQFSLYQALNRVTEAEQVLAAWTARSGQPDAEMERALQAMRQGQLEAERERIKEAVGEADGR